MSRVMRWAAPEAMIMWEWTGAFTAKTTPTRTSPATGVAMRPDDGPLASHATTTMAKGIGTRRPAQADRLCHDQPLVAFDASQVARTRAIEAVHHRIETDEFGWNEACDALIGVRRLELDPTLARSVGCACQGA